MKEFVHNFQRRRAREVERIIAELDVAYCTASFFFLIIGTLMIMRRGLKRGEGAEERNG